MPLAFVVTPKLVRVLDQNQQPVDAWVVECPSWLENYMRDPDFLQNSSISTVSEIIQSPVSYLEEQELEETKLPQFNVYYAPDRTNFSSHSANLVPSTVEILPIYDVESQEFKEWNTSSEEESSSEIIEQNHVSFEDGNDPLLKQEEPSSLINYNIYEDPSIIHAQATGDFIPIHPSNPIYDQSSFLNPMDHNLYQQQFVAENFFIPHSIYPTDNFSYQSQEHDTSYICKFPPPSFQEVLDSPTLPVNPMAYYQSDSPSIVKISEDFTMQSVENGAFFIGNSLWRVSVFLSFGLQEFGLSHPLGQVRKTHRSLTCTFTLHTGITCYVKFLPFCIKFSSNRRGIAYLVDEAGVRTCWESFDPLEEQVSETMWTRSRGKGINLESTKSFRHGGMSMQRHHQKRGRDAPSQVNWHAVPEGEPILITRDGMRFHSNTSDLSNLNVEADKFFLNSNLHEAGGRTGYIQIKNSRHRFRQSLYFNGKILQVKFHTQSASLDKDGKLSLSEK